MSILADYSSEFFCIKLGRPVVEATRYARPFESVAEMEAEMAEVHRVMAELDRARLGLLCDLREVVGRNDAEFESAFRLHRKRLQSSFFRVAIVVKSPAGLLHIQRLAQEDGDAHVRAFTSVPAALEWLGAELPPS